MDGQQRIDRCVTLGTHQIMATHLTGDIMTHDQLPALIRQVPLEERESEEPLREIINIVLLCMGAARIIFTGTGKNRGAE